MKLAKTLSFCALFFCAANIFSQSRPVATSISAKAGRERTIQIKWEFPISTEPKITGAKLYRAAKPFSSYKELQDIEPLVYFFGTSYVDTVTRAGEYFYAVIAVTERGDYKTIIPGMNATLKGVRPQIPVPREKPPKIENPEPPKIEMPAPPAIADNEPEIKKPIPPVKPKTKAKNSIRKTPLPFPGTILGFDQEGRHVDEKAMQSVQDLAKSNTQKPKPFASPYFFEEDMFSPDGGDEYILFETLRAGLAQKKYRESVKLLTDFLSVNRNPKATSRAEFYLGESLYFCKDYEGAIRRFLAVQDVFPELAKQWLDSSLDLLEID